MKNFKSTSLLLVFCGLLLVLPTHFALAIPSAQELRSHIETNLLRVREFQSLAQLAEDRGLRLFLFGGSASAMAYYSWGDLLQQHGEIELDEKRFNYDLFNILRSYQDIDFVVTRRDGSPETTEDIEGLKAAAMELYPDHFAGQSDKAWDFRGLKTRHAHLPHLDPILGPDYQNQINDSLSTGLIELTTPSGEESRVRNALDWNNQDGEILTQTFVSGKVRLQWSDRHHTIRNYKNQLSPYLKRVVRLVAKASQYGLDISNQDRSYIDKMMEKETDQQIASSKGFGSFSKNAIKIIKGSLDFEHAFEVLKKLGLDRRLRNIAKISQDKELEYWLNKQALPSSKEEAQKLFRWARKPTGKTAGELGLTVVTHATHSWEVIESVSWNYNTKPNLLASRARAEGEAARFGDGVYSVRGEAPLLTYGAYFFHMDVDSRAEEGVDFKIIPISETEEPFVLWSNTRYLKVRVNSLDVSEENVLSTIFQLEGHDHDDLMSTGSFSKANQGQIERLKLWALSHWSDVMDDQFMDYAQNYVDQHFNGIDIYQYDEEAEDQRLERNYKLEDPFGLHLERSTRRFFERVHKQDPQNIVKWFYYCELSEGHWSFCSELGKYLSKVDIQDFEFELVSLGTTLLDKGILPLYRVIDRPNLLDDTPGVHFRLISHLADCNYMGVVRSLSTFTDDSTYLRRVESVLEKKLTVARREEILNMYRNDLARGWMYISPSSLLTPLAEQAISEYIQRDKYAALETLKSTLIDGWKGDRDPKRFIQILSRNLWNELNDPDRDQLREYFQSQIRFDHYTNLGAFQSPLIHHFPDIVEDTLKYFFSFKYAAQIKMRQAKEFWNSISKGRSVLVSSDAVTIASYLFMNEEINNHAFSRTWLRKILKKDKYFHFSRSYFSQVHSFKNFDILKEHLSSNRKGAYDIAKDVLGKIWVSKKSDFVEYFIDLIVSDPGGNTRMRDLEVRVTFESAYYYLRFQPKLVIKLLSVIESDHDAKRIMETISNVAKDSKQGITAFDQLLIQSLGITDKNARLTYLQHGIETLGIYQSRGHTCEAQF